MVLAGINNTSMVCPAKFYHYKVFDPYIAGSNPTSAIFFIFILIFSSFCIVIYLNFYIPVIILGQ
jgi:hypothetical protein